MKYIINVLRPIYLVLKNKYLFICNQFNKNFLKYKSFCKNNKYYLKYKVTYIKSYEIYDKINNFNKKKLLSVQTLLINFLLGLIIKYYLRMIFIGVNYRAKKIKKLNRLILTIGNSYSTLFKIPDYSQIYIIRRRTVLIVGLTDLLVSRIAFFIQKLCPINVYTGKGLKFRTEFIRLKRGKRT